ncbi:MAG: DUF2092 domain-containing protein [Deltaproteobacteria bacterium]
MLPASFVAAQESNPDIDPKAESLLQEMSYFMGSKYQYTFKAEIMYDVVLESGQKVQYDASETVYLKKPDKFYVQYISDLGGYKIWYDTGKVTLLEVPANDFSLATLPQSVDQALDKLYEQYGFAPALSEFLFINTFKTMTKNVVSAENFGPSKVFGVKCQHLYFVEKDIDWQIWIEDGKRPIPRKLVITYKNLPESPQFIAILKDWIFDKSITNFAFKPEIPNVNKRVEFSEITGNPKFKMGSIRAFQ